MSVGKLSEHVTVCPLEAATDSFRSRRRRDEFRRTTEQTMPPTDQCPQPIRRSRQRTIDIVYTVA